MFKKISKKITFVFAGIFISLGVGLIFLLIGQQVFGVMLGGDLDAGGMRIINLGAGEDDSEAVTKNYVDAALYNIDVKGDNIIFSCAPETTGCSPLTITKSGSFSHAPPGPGGYGLSLGTGVAISGGLYVAAGIAGSACTGEVTFCEEYKNQGQCTQQEGCEWEFDIDLDDYICQGQTTFCSTYLYEGDCNDQDGCNWETTYATAANFDGRVGILKDDPGNYELYVTGSAYATGFWNSSDIRWKKNIEPITNALNRILDLRGVNFEWDIENYPDQGFDKGKQIGLIAQELEKIIPELVFTNTDGYKAISYERLIPVLIEAIKELKMEIEELEQRVELLEEKTNSY